MNNNGINKKSIYDFEINQNSEVKETEPTLYVGGSIFGAKGEISFISGKAKAGKTSVATIIMAQCLIENPSFDSLGIEGTFCENDTILYIDTEQSKTTTKKIIDKVLNLCELKEQPKNFKTFNLRTESIKDRKIYIEQSFECFGTPYMVFIDGLGDLVTSANDEKEACEIMQFFANLAEKYNCSIVLFLHETPNSDKMRGHLGSEAERKCFATISISKDRCTQTHQIKPKLFRQSKDFDIIEFAFNETDKCMNTIVSCAKPKTESKFDLVELRNLINVNEKITSKEFVSRIMKFKGIARQTALNRISEMLLQNLVAKEEKSRIEVFYFLSEFVTTQI